MKKIANLLFAVLLLSSLTYFVPDKVKLVCISDDGVSLYFSNKCKKHSQDAEISKQLDPCKDVVFHQHTPESLKKFLFKKQEKTKIPSYYLALTTHKNSTSDNENKALEEKISRILSVKLLI